MHLIQGDRGFRKWKGSVLDSIMGVFLTQNVSDNLSSDAFITLAATFPPQPTGHLEIRESVESNVDTYGNQYFVREPEPEIRQVESHYFLNNEVKHPESQKDLGLDEVAQTENENEKSSITSQSQEMPISEEPISVEKKNENSSDGSSNSPEESMSDAASKEKSPKAKRKEKRGDAFWESLRMKYSTQKRSKEQMDSVDWEAVRLAQHSKVAEAIKKRGQNNKISERIQAFLNRVVNLHKSLDLEWLRNVPPELAKEYLLEVNGLGLKSVECIRLLSLEHVAFPVDTNVGRIAIRLGWVPLQPLPGDLQLHLLDQYPLMDSIQKYLWPRLCNLDQKTLYELHYHMITFGKVFCTQINPNCNACPMRAECKHFASAYASTRLALPGAEGSSTAPQGSSVTIHTLPSSVYHCSSEPVIDEQVDIDAETENLPCFMCEPIVEEPVDVEPVDIEDVVPPRFEPPHEEVDSEGIPIFKLNVEKFMTGLSSYMDKNNIKYEDGDNSKALVALDPKIDSIPMTLRKLRRLRTEHLVYELPRNHCLLRGLEQTESDQDIQYHLAIWRPGDTPNSWSWDPPSDRCKCNFTEPGQLCDNETCYSCNRIREEQANIVRATLLIPCRVAMRDSFPLNGTYFQVNEVFADHETSLHPVKVSRDLIYNLRCCTALFGTSVHSLFRGSSSLGLVQRTFWKGLICVRAFDRCSRSPMKLTERFHPTETKRHKEERMNMQLTLKLGDDDKPQKSHGNGNGNGRGEGEDPQLI